MLKNLLYEDDKELLASLADNNKNALKILYQKYWEQLFLSAYNVLKDKEACEDIVQEIFIEIWERRATLNITTSLRAYLFTATRYQVFSWIKKSASRVDFGNSLEGHFSMETPDIIFHRKDLNERVNVAVTSLPDKCRNIYRLSRDYDLSYKEIADILQISPKTVENQLSIAFKKLRKYVGNYLVFTPLILPLLQL